MNTLEQLEKLLPPVLQMTGIKEDEYLIVSGAAEFLAGLGTRFGDVDILISPKTFKRLRGEMFQYAIRDFAGKPTRVIRVGYVDLIEHTGDWFNVPRNPNVQYPIMDDEHLVKWRIEIGRHKDQLRAWQLIHQLRTRPSSVDEKTSNENSFNEAFTEFSNMLMAMA